MSLKCAYCDKEFLYRFNGEIPCCSTHYYRLYSYGDPHYKRKTNEFKVDGDIVYLKTSKGNLFKIDTEDHERIKGSRWTKNASGGYLVARRNNRLIRLHRLIMGVLNDLEVVVDHIDGDVNNNLKENLRVTTQRKNARNTTYHYNAEIKYPGVRETASGTYQARIYVDGKEIHIGNYESVEKAIEARKEAETKYFGEYSYHKSRSE